MSDVTEPEKKEKPKTEYWQLLEKGYPPYREYVESNVGIVMYKHDRFYDVNGEAIKGVKKWKPMKG
jgi:hypothetical protein